MADKETVARLTEEAFEFRLKFVDLCHHTGEAIHIGTDMSTADMLVALYFYKMNIDPKVIDLPTRDRFVLSKGHCAVSLYVAMAMRGYFDFEDIKRTYGQPDSAFGMHPSKAHLPALDTSGGSLGHGLPIADGFALAARARGDSHRVYCMMGDGETCEGSVWEAAQTAASYELGNLVGIVDRNKQFMCTYSETDIKLEPYADKWRAFGWNVIEVQDGNDMAQLVDALDSLPETDSKQPTLLLLNTLKGKGVSYMEGQIGWHSNVIDDAKYEIAVAEITAARDAWRERGVDA
jgi:transketolase